MNPVFVRDYRADTPTAWQDISAARRDFWLSAVWNPDFVVQSALMNRASRVAELAKAETEDLMARRGYQIVAAYIARLAPREEQCRRQFRVRSSLFGTFVSGPIG